MSTIEKRYSVYYHKTPANKYYVGVSLNPHKRWGNNGYGYRTQPKFYNAIKKYGWNNIEHIIVETDLSLSAAYKLEKQLITKYDAFNNGYNADLGGTGAEGHVVSEQSKKYMRQLKLGKKWTDQQRQKVLDSRNYPVYVYSVNGQLLNTYKNAAKAAADLKIPRSSIVNACNNLLDYNDTYIFVNSKTQKLLNKKFELYRNKIERKNADTVFQYSLDGKLLCGYKTITEAARQTNIPIGTIGQSCSNFRLHIQDTFFLHTTDIKEVNKRVKAIKQNKATRKLNTNDYYKVGQYALDGELIAVYNTYKDASIATGYSRKAIGCNCVGMCKTVGRKYIFKKILIETEKEEK